MLLSEPDENAPALIESGPNGTAVHLAPQWAAIAVVAVFALVVWTLVRRIKRWDDRPRWLLPTFVALAVAACALSLAPFSVTKVDPVDGSVGCVALVSAWDRVESPPNASDLAAYRSALLSPAQFRDPAAVQAARRATRRPEYQRVEAYFGWAYAHPNAACAPRARQLLSAAAILLAIGLLAAGGALKLNHHKAQD
jgi:hypothetical protein